MSGDGELLRQMSQLNMAIECMIAFWLFLIEDPNPEKVMASFTFNFLE